MVRGRKEKGKCNYAVEIVVWKKEGLKMRGLGGIGERVVKKIDKSRESGCRRPTKVA